MKPEDYELVRELFHTLVDLPRDQREKALREKNVSAEIIAQVESLLEHDEEMDPVSEVTPRYPSDARPVPDPDRVGKLAAIIEGALDHDEVRDENPKEDSDRDTLTSRDVPGSRSRESETNSAPKLSRKYESFFEQLKRIYGEGAEPEHSLHAASGGPSHTDRGQGGIHDRYELRGRVAEGGMGKILRVWDKPLRRHIAMKVISGTGSSEKGLSPSPSTSFIRRFVEEAQITGQLDHPGVVPVHELAMNEKGEVFFTMRLIRGITFKEVIRKVKAGEDGWTLTRAMNRMLRICETMAFAHTRNVLHRDIKPANIMLGDFGETYVMDWGLAKILGRPDEVDHTIQEDGATEPSPIETDRIPGDDLESDAPVYTLDGEVIGTPAYMPPEQASGKKDKLGLQADVYAMGAVLYHLLSGQPPYVPSGTRLSAREILQRVKEGPPERLSMKVRGVPEELIAICNKAMAREIDDRYPDMGAMAEDVRAFLEQRVVRAHRTGAVPEFKKWVARNKVLVGGLAATIVALILGLAGTWMGLRQATQQRDEAELARDQLEVVVDFQAENLRSLRVTSLGSSIIDDLREEFTSGLDRAAVSDSDRQAAIHAFESSLGNINSTNLARNVASTIYLERAVKKIDDGFTKDPIIEAQLRESIGDVYYSLGLYEKSLEQRRLVLDLRQQGLGGGHLDTLAALRDVGSAYKMMGRLAEAEPCYLEALTERRRILGDDHEITLTSLNDLADLCRRMRKFDDAEYYYREVIERRTRLLGQNHTATLDSMNDYGVLLYNEGKPIEALEYFEPVLEKRRQELGPDHGMTLTVLNNVMSALFNVNQYEKAENYARDALDSYIRLKGDDHPSTILARNNLGRILYSLEKYEESENLIRVAYETSLRVLPPESEVRMKCISNLVDLYTKISRPAEAEALCKELLAVRRAVKPPPMGYIAMSLEQLGICFLDQKKYGEAESALRECLDIRAGLDNTHWSTHKARSLLGAALAGLGRIDEAKPMLMESIEGLKEEQYDIPVEWRDEELQDAEDRLIRSGAFK